jgi:hypothetical protein
MPCVTRQLESSVAYVWRAKVAGPGERLRHWRTRTGYYQVITHLLEAQGSSSLGMAEVVGRAGGGRSTVYAVAADGTLAEAYRAGTRPAVRMLADLAGAGPIDRLVAETKVWSFWPLRQAWLRELDELFPAAEFASTGRRLAASVARWRAAHPVLAAAQAGLPPLCALEDLIIVSRYTLSPSEAVRMLARGEPAEPGASPVLRCPMIDDAGVGAVAARINGALDLLEPAGRRSSTALPEHERTAAAASLLRATLRDLVALQTVRCEPLDVKE